MPKQSATQMVYHINPQGLARLLRGREQRGEPNFAVRVGDMGQGMINFAWGAVRVFFEAELAHWRPPQETVTYQFQQGLPPVPALADKSIPRWWEKFESRPAVALLHVSSALVESPQGRLYRKCTNGTGGVIWLQKQLTDLLAESAVELRLDLRFEAAGKQPLLRVSKPQNPYAMQRGDPTTYETVAYFAPGPDLKEDLGASTPLGTPAFLFTCLLCARTEQDQADDTAARQAKMYSHLMNDHGLSQVDIQRARRGERLEWGITGERAGILRLPQPAFLQATREEGVDLSGQQGAHQAELEP